MTVLTPRSLIFLRAIVEHYHSGSEGEILAKSLPIETAQSIVDIQIPAVDPKSLFIVAEKILSGIHYSWICDAFKCFDKSMYPFLISILPKSHIKGMEQLMGVSSSDKELSPAVKKFFQIQLLSKIDGASTALPQEFLNSKPLSELLSIDKNVILEMFDLLGLYDLAAKVKFVIDKSTLNNIYASLSPVKKKFLNLFLRQVDKVQLSEIDLADWSGDPNILKKMIHRRGILRLGKALAGYPKDFLWYLTHRLDTGRGKIILRHYEEEDTEMSGVLTEQVIFIINTLTKKNES